MDLLLKNVKIVQQGNNLNGTKKDILIEKGKIVQIRKNIKANKTTKVYSAPNLHVSVGWIDFRTSIADPGHEYVEDLNSTLSAAAHGGYTAIVTMPTTKPVVDNKSGIEYIINKSKNNIVDIFPTGALSIKAEGEDIAEMYDMKQAGAVAFTDNKNSINNPSLLNRALLYNLSFNGLIINFPYTASLSKKGQINEGIISTELGLKGIPSLSEELMVNRDIYLAEYCNSPIHLSNISTKKSVELIKDAKKRGIRVTCDVNSYHLYLTDKELENFDTNYKVIPPLRTKQDVTALIKGIKDGTIDIICSDHTPVDIEDKQCEFDHAAFGMINLQTSFSIQNSSLEKKLDLEKSIELITTNPRNILKIKTPIIKEGEDANLTLFDPSVEWKLNSDELKSNAKNSPFVGKKLKGKALAIVNKNKFKVI